MFLHTGIVYFAKFLYVKIVEAVRPAENVDVLYTFSDTTSFQSFLLKFGKNVTR